MTTNLKNSKKSIVIKVVALIAYSALVLIGALNHEYWYDEGQAWNIARDNDISGIFAAMKAEGHPPLWHLILHIFTSLGCSCVALGLVSWAISTATAALVLFKLPVKPYVQAALLASGGMIYINSVIARPYCLINLFLVIIAIIYPDRKKHPLLFGTMIALLANTHIVMCGLVGIYGIYMIIDLFKDWKTNSRKQNVLNLCGLAIAGAGVIMLVLPLLGSTDRLVIDTPEKYTAEHITSALFMSVTNICKSATAQTLPMGLGRIPALILEVAIIVLVVLIFRDRRTFISTLVFSAFFILIDEIVWFSQPNRGALFVFTIVSIVVAGRSNEQSLEKQIKVKNESLRELIEKFRKFIGKKDKMIPVLLSAILFMTTPFGVYFYVMDIAGEFDQGKAGAEFIDRNISKDALLVSVDRQYAHVCSYLPNREIYSLMYGTFYTYCKNESETNVDVDEVKKLAEEYDEIYFIHPEPVIGDTVFYDTNCVDFYMGHVNFSISKIDSDELIEYAEGLVSD